MDKEKAIEVLKQLNDNDLYYALIEIFGGRKHEWYLACAEYVWPKTARNWP